MSKLRENFDGNYKPPKDSSKVRRVTTSRVFVEAKCAGIDPQEFVDKINTAIDEQEANESTNYSAKERRNIFEMARQAGININDPAQRKRALEAYNGNPDDKDSLLENEAMILYKRLKADDPNSRVTLRSVREMLLKEREAKRAEELKSRKIDYLIRETMLAGGFRPKK